MAMGHNLWLHFGVDEHSFATYFDVHQEERVLTHSHVVGPDSGRHNTFEVRFTSQFGTDVEGLTKGVNELRNKMLN